MFHIQHGSSFPVCPFFVYFLHQGKVIPKQMFIITKVEVESSRVRLYVRELHAFIEGSNELVVVHGFSVN